MDDYSRRAFIRTSLPGFLGLTLALPSITTLATRANACNGRIPADGAIHWDAFLEAVTQEAARQHLDDWNDAAYVKRAAAIVRRLKARSLTQLVDIFAPPYNKDRVARSRWFDVDPEPFEGRPDVFESKVR